MMAAPHRTPIDAVIDRLAEQGCNPRQSGPQQWSAKCPVAANHRGGDRNPSLSVSVGHGDKVLMHCHRGCTLPEVAGAINLGVRDLFPERPTQIVDGGRAAIKATYAYTDADGEVLFEVVRMAPKGFRQRRPDGRGGWVWNLDGITPRDRPLYHLPQVLAAVAARRDVWIVEGEKDAENLQWALPAGCATTCNSGGADTGNGGKWMAHHAETLRGGTVVIVPDNDDPGRRHAAHVANSLIGVANFVVRQVPAQWKDASEAIGSGSDPRGWAIVEPDVWQAWAGDVAEVETETIDDDDVFAGMVLDWAEFWQQDHAAEAWALEPLIPKGRAVAVYAPAKAGKSLTLLSAIVPATLGATVWGLTPAPRIRVLYLDYEMTAGDLRERLEMLGYEPDTDLSHLHYALIPSLPPLDTAEGGRMLLLLAQRHAVDVVIVDTFGRAAQGDENDADTARAFYRHCGSVLKAHGIAVARTDHAGKDLDKGQRGSSAKNDDVDVVWRLERLQGGIKITRTHSRVIWVPESVVLDVHEDDDGVWHFRRQAGSSGWPAGTKEAAADLDAIGAPVDISARQASRMLSDANRGRKAAVVRAAVKWRRQESERLLGPRPDARDAVEMAGASDGSGRAERNTDLPAGTRHGTRGTRLPSHRVPQSVSLDTDAGADHDPTDLFAD